ncbi:MAG: hypothetical protein ACJZ47_00465 [bacterium]
MSNVEYKIRNNRVKITYGNWGYYMKVLGSSSTSVAKLNKVFGEKPDIKCYAESVDVDVDVLGNSSSTSEVVSSSNKTPVSSGSGNKLLQSIKEQLDRIEKKLKFIGIE